ncbi:hypothetical protein FP507_03475 [Chlorobium phaeovibrioides]|uniref:Uncharacterized protein n=2 Tax=Chlorobium phaeovibrioides TaxID=1094 RepID=A0A5M8I9W2_CHLPH|nr:hypothetical protein FP507_03475 [Chlorobium phaeovibrioides]
MIWRLNSHESLLGHFLIIAALYYSLNTNLTKRKTIWSLLLVGSSLVHAYLLAMVALIWLSDLVGLKIKHRLTIRNAILELIVVFILVCIACWQAGYFTIGNSFASGGYGYFRMNMFSLIDPSGWSYILSDLPESPGDYEGFNYLGLGMIVLSIFAVAIAVDGKVGVSKSIRKYPILLFVLAVLALFSVSCNIGIGMVDYKIHLPKVMIIFANIFRASGRMFWPVFYMLYFVVIFLVVRGHPKKTVMFLLVLALVIQISDTRAGWKGIRDKYMSSPTSTIHNSLTDPFWGLAASKYTKVRIIPPGNAVKLWLPVAAYAGTHGLATDATYLGRVSSSAVIDAQKKASEAITAGKYEHSSLYFLDKGSVRTALLNLNAENDLLALVDDMYVLAPRWKKYALTATPIHEVIMSDILPLIKLGETFSFIRGGTGLDYLGCGWSGPEPWGTWSDGSNACLIFHLPKKTVSSISIQVAPFLSKIHPKQDVELFINDFLVKKITMTANSASVIEVKIPERFRSIGLNDHLLTLGFKFADSVRPKDIGINDDSRRLALGIISCTIY